MASPCERRPRLGRDGHQHALICALEESEELRDAKFAMRPAVGQSQEARKKISGRSPVQRILCLPNTLPCVHGVMPCLLLRSHGVAQRKPLVAPKGYSSPIVFNYSTTLWHQPSRTTAGGGELLLSCANKHVPAPCMTDYTLSDACRSSSRTVVFLSPLPMLVAP